MGTLPRTPSTRRTTRALPSPGGMQSTRRTTPSSVSSSVSRMRVPGRYRRVQRRTSACGASSQRPCDSSPSRAAKLAAESNRGRHSQSIEPSRPTSADPAMFERKP
jgi:hypothetical protein